MMKSYPPVVIMPHSKFCRIRHQSNPWSGTLIEQFYGNYKANRDSRKHHLWHVFSCNDAQCAAQVAIHAWAITNLAKNAR